MTSQLMSTIADTHKITTHWKCKSINMWVVRPMVWPAHDTSWPVTVTQGDSSHILSFISVMLLFLPTVCCAVWVSGLYKSKNHLCFVHYSATRMISFLQFKRWHDLEFCDLPFYSLRDEILRNNIHYAYKESQNCSHQEYFLSRRNDCSHLLSVISCFDQSTLLINISPPGAGATSVLCFC